jgi:hypothetical protein
MNRRVGAFGLWAVGGVLAGTFSCRQLVGIADQPAADQTPEACGLSYGTSTCAACVAASCCAESTACAADPLFCYPLESCLGGCNGDAACRSKCTIDHPVPENGAAPVSALSACLASSCEAACGLTCGGFAGNISQPDASKACQTCIENGAACKDAHACGASPECDAFWRCYLACSTPDCQTSCGASHDAGAALFRPLYQDFANACATQCGYGTDFTCAGHVAWPGADSTEYVWTEWVYDWETKKGVAGATVQVCTNCPCPTATNGVVGSGQTDANGYITIRYQQGLSPTGEGSLYCYQTTADGYLTSFAYGGFPQTNGAWSVVDGLLPPEAWGVVLLSPAAQQRNDVTIGATYDPNRAILVTGGVFDCLGSPAQANGASVSINVRDPMLVALGQLDAGPDAWPTVPTGSGSASTLGTYSADFFDVPADASVILTATVPGVGVVSQVSANLAPGTVTQVGLPPTPIP